MRNLKGEFMGLMTIEVQGESYRAELLDDKAPQTCAEFKSRLPFMSLLSHAKICDNEITAQAPFFIDLNENMVIPWAGSIGFWRFRPTICMWYDHMKPLGPTNHFAQITDDLERFQAMAREVWFEPGALVKFGWEAS
jgi:hypothetical protein